MLVDISSVVLNRDTRRQNRRKQGVLIFGVNKLLCLHVCAYLVLFAKFTTTVFGACAQLGDHVT